MQNGVSSTSTDSSYLYSNRVVVARLPTKCSRHNTTSRAHAITKLVKNTCFSSSGFEKAETRGDKIENILVRIANYIICKIILIPALNRLLRDLLIFYRSFVNTGMLMLLDVLLHEHFPSTAERHLPFLILVKFRKKPSQIVSSISSLFAWIKMR